MLILKLVYSLKKIKKEEKDVKKIILTAGMLLVITPFLWNFRNLNIEEKKSPETKAVRSAPNQKRIAKKMPPGKLKGGDKIRFARWAKSATPEDILRVKTRHLKSVRAATVKHNVDQNIVAAIVYIESNGRNLIGKAGERGPMQITPSTGKLYGADLKCLEYSPCNIRVGTRIMKDQLEKHGNNPLKAVAAYNRGSIPKHFDPAADYHVNKFAHALYALSRIY